MVDTKHWLLPIIKWKKKEDAVSEIMSERTDKNKTLYLYPKKVSLPMWEFFRFSKKSYPSLQEVPINSVQ